MSFTKLINNIQNTSNDSKRNEILENVMGIVDMAIDGETFKTILSKYTNDSYRNDAINILIQNSGKLDSGIVYGIARMYNNDSYRCDALKIIMRKCDSIMNDVSVNILKLFRNDSYRADATKTIINHITNIDEETIYELIGLYNNDSYRSGAIKTISTSNIIAQKGISIKTPERYLSLFHNDSYRLECFESITPYIDNTNSILLYNCVKTFGNDSYKSGCVKSWKSVAKCNVDSNILELFQNESYRLQSLKYLYSNFDLSESGVNHNYIVSLFSDGSYAVSALKLIKSFAKYDVNNVYTLLRFIRGDKYRYEALKIIVNNQDDIYRGQPIGELLSLLSKFKDCLTIYKIIKIIGNHFEKDQAENIICEKLAEVIDGQKAYRKSCDILGLDKTIYEPYAVDIMPELPKDTHPSSSSKHTKEPLTQSSYTVENDFTNGYTGEKIHIEYIGNLVKKTITSADGSSISITVTPRK